MIEVPELCDKCNSWVIVDNGKPVIETWSADFVKQVADRDMEGIAIYTSLQWLQKFNANVN